MDYFTMIARNIHSQLKQYKKYFFKKFSVD